MNHINSSWLSLLDHVFRWGVTCSPRGMKTKESMGEKSIIDMDFPVLTVVQRELGYRFMCAEAWWILSGSNKVADIAPYSGNISKFSDDGEVFNGAYGPKVVDQLQYVANTLEQDVWSRQAVINIWREKPAPSKDIPCTISTQFLIRDNLLHLIHTMRSSDLWLGYPYDLFNFTMVAAYLALMLRQRGFDNLTLGNLHFTAGSQHIYEKNFPEVSGLIQSHRENGTKERFDYKPLNLDEFQKPEELLAHLALLKDRRFDDIRATNITYLRELEAI